MKVLSAAMLLVMAATVHAQQHDLLLKGGHLIDPRNNISAVRDVAIRDGRVVAVAEKIDPATAFKTIDVAGLYVTPGLIDLHVHVFTGTAERRSYAGDLSVYPDGFTFRSGVTTAVDAGCAGWRNFPEFKSTIIDRSRTRILALLNIVGHGMRGSNFENNLDDMEVGPTAEMAQAHKGRDRWNQDGALRWAGIHSRGTGRRCRDESRHSRDGRFWPGISRSVAGRLAGREAAAGRHLHARLFGPPRRA